MNKYSEFDKVIGYGDIVAELNRICDCMREPEKYRALGVTTPCGILLHGEPGLGKTLMARCFIEASGRKTYTCRKNLPDGEFVKELQHIFAKAKESAPSIVFLDDMDKFANEDSYHRNAEEFVTVQSCIDDCKGCEVFVLATANDLHCIPDSLLRTGRFDKSIKIAPPEGVDAARIVAHYLQTKKCADDVDAVQISQIMAGKSCADLETVVNEAGLYAAYEERDKISMADVVRACLRILYNAPEEISLSAAAFIDRTAYHEAGHALIAELLSSGCVSFVSVSACSSKRSDVAGITVTSNPDGYFHSIKLMENRIISILGGKAASEIVFGEVDTGANGDLHRAFDIVERFADNYCSYGFDKWTTRDGNSDALYARKDSQIAADMQRYYEQAKSLLREHRTQLDKLAHALIERKTLIGSEVRAIISAGHENVAA